MTTKSHVEKIADLLISCHDEAVRQGSTDEFCPTAGDFDWCIERLGSRPTKALWLEAAEIAGIEMKWVGPKHCADGATAPLHYMAYCGNNGIPGATDWTSALRAAKDCLGTSPSSEVTIVSAADPLDLLLSDCCVVRAGLALELAEHGVGPEDIFAEHGQIDVAA